MAKIFQYLLQDQTRFTASLIWQSLGIMKDLDICAEENKKAVEKFIKNQVKIDQKADYEKEGVFTGRFAINPFNNEKVPLYVLNFVLAEYGSGAVMSVPAS